MSETDVVAPQLLASDAEATTVSPASRRVLIAAALGMLAWLTTVLPLLIEPELPVLSRIAGVASLLFLVGASLLRGRRPVLARRVGVGLFVAAAVACWLLAGERLAEVGPFAGFVGACAWVAFATSWPEPWTVPEGELSLAPEADTRGLEPRARLPWFIYLFVSMAGVSASATMWLAWEVRDADRGLLAHVLAFTAAVALLSGAAAVSVRVMEPKLPTGGSSRWRRRTISWLLWVLLAVLTAVVWRRFA